MREYENGVNFCFRNGLDVLEEGLYGGVPVSLGFNTAGYPLDVLTNCPSRLDPRRFSEPFAFDFEIDGETACRKMKLVSRTEEKTKNGVHTALVFESGIKPVRIYAHTVSDGTGVFTRYYEIENLSDKPVNLSRAVLKGGGTEETDCRDHSWVKRPSAGSAYSIGYFKEDCWGAEGGFDWEPLHGCRVINCRFDAERFRHPAVFIRNELSGNIIFCQSGFSGGCRFTADCEEKDRGDRISLSLAAELTGCKPLAVLRPGERFTTPELHLGAVHGTLDDAVNSMNRHLRRSVFTLPGADRSPCLVGAGMGAEHDMSVETTKAFICQMAEMGAEVFIIDAGWVCPPGKETEWHRYNGLNKPDKDRYPGNSFDELRELCHSKNMKLGLWVEIERAGEYSGIKQAHPEWFSCDLYGENGSAVLDLTVPDAAEWAENELARIITEYKLDLLRVDYNVSGVEQFCFRDTGTGTEECLSLRHYNAVYRMYSSLKARFPDVIFENCAGGGGRTDAGMLKAFNHTWVSDEQIMPHSAVITNGMTLVLPPERVDRLFAGMGCHRAGSLDAHIRNCMLTHISLNVISPAAAKINGEAMAFIRHSVNIYKTFIRPMLPKSEIYHHTPAVSDIYEKGYCALELASASRDRSAVAVFKIDGTAADTVTVFPRGINPDGRYKVTLDNSRASYTADGSALISNGIKTGILAPLSSELILIAKM